jgi:hypothetical protein
MSTPTTTQALLPTFHYIWQASVNVDTGDVGIHTPAGWAHQLSFQTEYPDFGLLMRDLPKAFDALVPYKNIGGYEPQLDFYKTRIAEHFEILKALATDAVDFSDIGYFYAHSEWNRLNLNEIAPGFTIEIGLAPDGKTKYTDKPTNSDRFELSMVVNRKRTVSVLPNSNLDPDDLLTAVEYVLTYVPNFVKTGAVRFWLLYRLVSLIQNSDLSTLGAEGNRINLKLADYEFDFILSKVDQSVGA